MSRNSKTMLLFVLGGWTLYLVSLMVPKNRSLWVFGAWFGEKFSDNSRHYFEYVNKNEKHIRAIWLTKNPDTIELIRSKGYEAYHPYSVKGTLLSLRAKIGILATGVLDINEDVTGGMVLVELWHGTPLKKILHDDSVSGKQTKFWKWLKHVLPLFKVKLITAPSDSVANIFSSAFRVSPEKIVITGYPRTDVFYREAGCELPIVQSVVRYKDEKNSKVGIYMPTHRQAGQADIIGSFLGELSNIDTELRKSNIILLVKLHFYHQKEIESGKYNYENIIFVKDKDIEQDVYPLLLYTDFLITDYSSIFFDYALLDNPMLFAAFDKESYLSKDRELYFEYETVVPGPILKNWKDLIDAINNLTKGDNHHLGKIKSVKKEFNKYTDGRNSERVNAEVFRLAGIVGRPRRELLTL